VLIFLGALIWVASENSKPVRSSKPAKVTKPTR
jgi:hypothetical protein